MSEIKENTGFNVEKFCEWADNIDWKRGLSWVGLDDDKFEQLRIRMFFDEWEYDQYAIEFPITSKISDMFKREIRNANFTCNGKLICEEKKVENFLKELIDIKLIVVFDGNYFSSWDYPRTMIVGEYNKFTNSGSLNWNETSDDDEYYEYSSDVEILYPKKKKSLL